MCWKIKSLFLILFISACESEKSQEAKVSNSSAYISQYLIEAEELISIFKNPHIKVLDFRKEEEYNAEHLDGALQIWRTDIENDSFPYSGMMPRKDQIESLFSNFGISEKDTIIVYDEKGNCDAARLWWIMQNYDFDNVMLLNGGLSAWKIVDGPITNSAPQINRREFKLSPTPSMKYYYSKDELQTILNTNTFILDTRSLDEFTGNEQKSGAFKAGRIPKSMHIDWVEAINFDGDKKLKSKEELEIIYSRLNAKKEDLIIVYCHSGVRSAHTTFVLTQLLGYKKVKNYDGSWTEWSYFDELEFEKDSLRTEIN